MSDLRSTLTAICAALPGAKCEHPFGDEHDAWKVGGKIFALAGAKNDGISVKCPDIDTADMLREVGAARKAPYLHKSWVQVPASAPEDEMRHRVLISYDVIRAALPKKVQAALPAR